MDIEQLNIDLSAHGTIVLCHEASLVSFVVVMTGVTDGTAVTAIINDALNTDYPEENALTLVGGVFKCEKNK